MSQAHFQASRPGSVSNPRIIVLWSFALQNSKLKTLRVLSNGAGGIRTPGTLRHNGFQDRLLKPLGHRSKLIAREGFVTLVLKSNKEKF